MKILDRINELANKEKVQPLTVAEKQEQHALRQDVTPDKVYDLRQQYGYIQN